MARPNKARGALWRVTSGISQDHVGHGKFYVIAGNAIEAVHIAQDTIAADADGSYENHVILEVGQIAEQVLLAPGKKRP